MSIPFRAAVFAVLLALAVLFWFASYAGAHEWFGDKLVQVQSEWTSSQYYNGPGGGTYVPEPPPPLRPGEEWMSGKTQVLNNQSCCDGKDCWEIEDSDWWSEGGLYRVMRDGKVYSIQSSLAQPSESKKGKAAACIYSEQLLCFFVPLSY